jgi:hypothetical protein
VPFQVPLATRSSESGAASESRCTLTVTATQEWACGPNCGHAATHLPASWPGAVAVTVTAKRPGLSWGLALPAGHRRPSSAPDLAQAQNLNLAWPEGLPLVQVSQKDKES